MDNRFKGKIYKKPRMIIYKHCVIRERGKGKEVEYQ
jgi:hypothetical protein